MIEIAMLLSFVKLIRTFRKVKYGKKLGIPQTIQSGCQETISFMQEHFPLINLTQCKSILKVFNKFTFTSPYIEYKYSV